MCFGVVSVSRGRVMRKQALQIAGGDDASGVGKADKTRNVKTRTSFRKITLQSTGRMNRNERKRARWFWGIGEAGQKRDRYGT